jgi:hypothetical protein
VSFAELKGCSPRLPSAFTGRRRVRPGYFPCRAGRRSRYRLRVLRRRRHAHRLPPLQANRLDRNCAAG